MISHVVPPSSGLVFRYHKKSWTDAHADGCSMTITKTVLPSLRFRLLMRRTEKKAPHLVPSSMAAAKTEELRTYLPGTKAHRFYTEMYKNQNNQLVLEKWAEYSKLNKAVFPMEKALELMDQFVDPSDPDVDVPNSIHAYQTAERIRRYRPEDTAFQVCGLIHDLGKILFSFGEPSWAVVGDTYVLGCAFPDTIVYHDELKHSPDAGKVEYSTELGIYQPHCGLENLHIAFGHDEYLYLVLKGNSDTHKLPKRYWNMIRFHSFYPWHRQGSYRQFMKGEEDEQVLKDVLELNQHDLYSKEDTDFVLTPEIKTYYSNLLKQYFPEPLRW